MKYTPLLLAALLAIGTLATPHPKTVEFKLALLCYENPTKDCAEIQSYCREALEFGLECYLKP